MHTDRRLELERTNFENFFNEMPELVAIFAEPEHVFEFINNSFMAQAGENAVSHRVRDVLPEAYEFIKNLDQTYRTGRTATIPEMEFFFNGHRCFFNFTFTARLSLNNDICGIMAMGFDVTEQVLGRESNKLHQNALELALANAPVADVLKNLAKMVELQAGTDLIASILIASRDGRQLFHGAAPGLPSEYNNLVNGITIGPMIGSCGAAAFQRSRVIVDDIATDARWKDFRELALSFGLRACWSTPILADHGQLLGTFALYARTCRKPTDREKQIIDIAARTTALVLGTRLGAEKMREKEADLRFVLASTGVRTWDVDFENGGLVEFSDVAVSEAGKPEHGKPSEVIDTRVFPEDRDFVRRCFNEAVEKRSAYHSEFRIFSPEGQVRWIDSHGRALVNDDGSIRRMTGIEIDFTERRKTEEALAEANRKVLETLSRLEATLNQMPVGVALFEGPDHIYAFTNAAHDSLLGGKTLQGLKLRDAVPEVEEQGIIKLLDEVYRTGVAYDAEEKELSLNQRGGTTKRFVLKFSYQPLVKPSGEIYGIAATVIDVSERKQLEQSMQLAKEDAEQANAAKSAFLANMSHEIRTPLGAIMGFSDLAKQPGTPLAEIQNFLSVVERNSTQVLRIIDDILDLAKVEAGRVELEKVPFALLEFLADFSSLMGFRAREAGIQFTLVADSDLPNLVVSDPTRLRQILTNAVGNAIKFTAKGFVTLHVSADGAILKFRVVDTGRGISEQQTRNLFQAFVQADVSTTRKFGGTGLGLVLTRRLCQLMGGDYLLEQSELDVGSVFTATIEIANAETTRIVPRRDISFESESTAPPPLSEGRLENISVLVVEDSFDNQQLVKLILERQGAKLDFAGDGALGFEKAISGRYEVVLMDIQMPVMDGHEAVRKLRAAGYVKPVVALTAHAMKEEMERAMRSGFTHFLTKPIQREALITMIANLAPR